MTSVGLFHASFAIYELTTHPLYSASGGGTRHFIAILCSFQDTKLLSEHAERRTSYRYPDIVDFKIR